MELYPRASTPDRTTPLQSYPMEKDLRISRRKFLGASSLIAGGIFAAPQIIRSQTLGNDAKLAANSRLGMGFIGPGKICRVMNTRLPLLLTLLSLVYSPLPAQRAFFGDPPDAHNPWAVHDRNRPAPPVVQPGDRAGAPPSDAIILFDGTQESFENWRHEKPEDERKASWIVKDGALIPQKGADYLMTTDVFGDCQLHLEWAAPEEF